MTEEYHDRWITCDADGLAVRGYYFPWGTKRISYARIKSVRQVSIGELTGRMRIWGTANPRYWASLDPKRPTKSEALILNLGRFVHPFITPDDVPAVAGVIAKHTGLTPSGESGSPVI